MNIEYWLRTALPAPFEDMWIRPNTDDSKKKKFKDPDVTDVCRDFWFGAAIARQPLRT